VATGVARPQNLAERLGYGPAARLLIVHADDLGLASGVNTAFADGQQSGLINSGSAMVPCPGFGEVAAFARAQPQADIGLHLTLTCPKVADPWGPVAPASDVPSLIDQRGCLHERWTSATAIRVEEVKTELRAQVDKAIQGGLHPTHLDSHQYLLQKKNAKLFEIFIQLGQEYGLPLLISKEWFPAYPYLQSLTPPDAVLLDRIVTIGADVKAEQWPEFYREALKLLPPGISEVLIHPAHDTEDLRAFFQGRKEWGATWRQRDLDFFTSVEFSSLLREENIELITWREIASRLH
jgi:predicted glycoside hydrolase/deacetylase ChbG (UPF0249 family)